MAKKVKDVEESVSLAEAAEPAVIARGNHGPIGEAWPDHPWVAMRPELAGRIYRCADNDPCAVGAIHEPHESTQKFIKCEGIVGINGRGHVKGAFWVDDPTLELRRE